MSDVKGYMFDELEIGMSAEYSHTISNEDVEKFAEVSGDYNPLHMDEAYAQTTPFQGRIVHGALTASYVSSILGNQLPGAGAIFSEISMRFRRPVKIGDTVHVHASVFALEPRLRRVTMSVKCTVNGKVVLESEAKVIIPGKR